MHIEAQSTLRNAKTSSRRNTLTYLETHDLSQRLDFGTKSHNVGADVAPRKNLELLVVLRKGIKNKMQYESYALQSFLVNRRSLATVNSDELRHTDNTTLIPLRLLDTLPQTYRSYVCFTHEPNLAERARISAINLDDYQLDPLTPPPSPSSLFSMAAYQRMIAETDRDPESEKLYILRTETGQNRCQFLRHLDQAFMTLWDVKPRVEESSLETLSVDELITQLRQVCEDARRC
ncbi:hypothetical protein Tco_0162065 [Tanacetum coccineum]